MLTHHLDKLGAAFVTFEKKFMSDKSDEDKSKIVAALRNKTVQTIKAVLDFTESCALRHELLITVAYLKHADGNGVNKDPVPYQVYGI